VPGVLDLDLREVLLGGAEAVHAPAGVEGEVGRVGGTHEVEAQPVRVVLAVAAADRGEEPLRRGVGADDQRHVAQPGQDLRAGVADGGRTGGAGGVARSTPAGPVHPSAWAKVAPATKPGYPLRMVSAPETNWMSRQVNPASARASRAAARPYSTNGRPHLPHGCMPAPRTAIRLSSGIAQASDPAETGAPLPHQVVGVVLRVERVDDQLDLVADLEVVDRHAADDLSHDHQLLGRQLDRGQAEGHVGIGRHVGRRRLVAGVGVGPDRPRRDSSTVSNSWPSQSGLRQ
jgi:hypothetical protein